MMQHSSSPRMDVQTLIPNFCAHRNRNKAGMRIDRQDGKYNLITNLVVKYKSEGTQAAIL